MNDIPVIEVNTDNIREHLFVVETPFEWVIWHITDMPDNEIYPSILPQLLPTLDDSHIMVSCYHFWTKDRMEDNLNNWVEAYRKIDESVDILFL